MINGYVNEHLFEQNSVDKQLIIEYRGSTLEGTITNEILHQEQFELTESICSDPELRIGSCEASCVKFRVQNIVAPLKGKTLVIKMVLNKDYDHPFTIGFYLVHSDELTADRRFRDITAYDVMHNIINANVSQWYESLTFPMTLKAFRDSFFSYLGVTAQRNVDLINDDITIEKTLSVNEGSVLSGKTVIESVCEINGCFGHIDRDFPRFSYIYLGDASSGVYPDDLLFPNHAKISEDDIIRSQTFDNALDAEGYVSDTGHWSEADGNHESWNAFDGDENTFWTIYKPGMSSLEGQYVSYNFGEDVSNATITIVFYKNIGSGVGEVTRFYIQGYNGSTWDNISDLINILRGSEYDKTKTTLSFSTENTYSAFRIYFTFGRSGNYYPKQGLDGRFKLYEFSVSGLKETEGEETGLYPQYPEGYNLTKYYISANYKDYVTKKITKLQIRGNENDIGCIVGTDDGNTYIIENNFLVYGKTNNELVNIANRILGKIGYISYRPFEAKVLGNPCHEVGDMIRITTKYDLIESYILSRTLKGIQSLKDTFFANGEETYTEKVNSSNREITQIKGITNELKRTVEETVSKISNLDDNIESEFKQRDDQIVLSVNASGNVVAVSLTGDREKGTTNFTVGADNISLSGKKIDLTGENVSITSNNFSVDKDGNVKAVGGDFKDIDCQDHLYMSRDGIDKSTVLHMDYRDPALEGISFIGDDEATTGAQNVLYIAKNIIGTVIFKSAVAFKKVTEINKLIVTKGKITAGTWLHLVGSYVRMDSNGDPDNVTSVVFQNYAFRPQNTWGGKISLGDSSRKWEEVFATKSTINTSDKNKKQDVTPIPEKYERIFDAIEPVVYRLKNETKQDDHDRIHIGAIAQQFEEACKKEGVNAEELSFFCKDKKRVYNDDDIHYTESQDEYEYGLRYGEWIMMNTHMIQKMRKENNELKEKCQKLQSEIDEIKRQISNNDSEVNC